MTFDREKIARAVADAQNVPFVGAKQRKIADAVIEAVRSEMTEEWAVRDGDGFLTHSLHGQMTEEEAVEYAAKLKREHLAVHRFATAWTGRA